MQQKHHVGNDLNAPSFCSALILDDHDFDRRRIRRFAQKSEVQMNIVDVPSLDAMQTAMRTQVFDLFLLDYELPGATGLEAIDLIQNAADQQDAAMIMITGRNQVEVAVSAFRHGCHDLITKEELSPSVLQNRVQTALQRARPEVRRDLFEEEKFQRQIQKIMRNTMQSEAMQSMINDSLCRAVRSSSSSLEMEDPVKIENFLMDFLRRDEFDFK